MDIKINNTVIAEIKSVQFNTDILVITGDYLQVFVQLEQGALQNNKQEIMQDLMSHAIHTQDVICFDDLAEDYDFSYTYSITSETNPIWLQYKSLVGVELLKSYIKLEIKQGFSNVYLHYELLDIGTIDVNLVFLTVDTDDMQLYSTTNKKHIEFDEITGEYLFYVDGNTYAPLYISEISTDFIYGDNNEDMDFKH